MAMKSHPKCRWCGRCRKPSEWEQSTLGGEWARLCVPCANRRLNNPWNALLPTRKIIVPTTKEQR